MQRAATVDHVSDGTLEIRYESIGGLGAHAAGQVLATAAVLRMGMNGAHFSSYGSEKKGTRIRSFIRLGPSNRPIRTNAPVETPNAIVVFHAALLRDPVTYAGLRRDGVFIYDAPAGPIPPQLAALPRAARAIRVDAQGIAAAERSRPNAVLLGTLCAAIPQLDTECVLEELNATFTARHPEAVAANERAFRRGLTEFEAFAGVGRAGGDLPPARSEPAWGYATQPLGGVIPLPGNTAWNDLSWSRTGYMAVLDRDKCVHCGVCDLVCPDLCFVWADGEPGGKYERELKGIDYRYCKGCLRCVESCPSGALSKQAETPGLADQLRVPLFPGVIP
ncbi:MAG: 2-oxoacid:acceptor oxidoreductase family protein [Chloroflexota bacterium]|nr:2-oxoacid:acceptor oxidoreductase family protein [Chloroflexota bacterium]